MALAYAETHPERVSELVVRGIYLLTRAELDWYYQFGVSQMFPGQMGRRSSPRSPRRERGDIVAAYRRRLTGDDPAVQVAAAKAWSLWEGQTITLLPDPALATPRTTTTVSRSPSRGSRTIISRTTAGWRRGNCCAMRGGCSGIPGTIVHGRYDMPCPARYAWALHQAWPEAEFHLVEGAGHAFSEPGILDRLIRATDLYAGQGGSDKLSSCPRKREFTDAAPLDC